LSFNAGLELMLLVLRFCADYLDVNCYIVSFELKSYLKDLDYVHLFIHLLIDGG